MRPPAVLSGINVTQHVLMRRNKWVLPLPRGDRLPVDTYIAAYQATRKLRPSFPIPHVCVVC